MTTFYSTAKIFNPNTSKTYYIGSYDDATFNKAKYLSGLLIKNTNKKEFYTEKHLKNVVLLHFPVIKAKSSDYINNDFPTPDYVTVPYPLAMAYDPSTGKVVVERPAKVLNTRLDVDYIIQVLADPKVSTQNMKGFKLTGTIDSEYTQNGKYSSQVMLEQSSYAVINPKVVFKELVRTEVKNPIDNSILHESTKVDRHFLYLPFNNPISDVPTILLALNDEYISPYALIKDSNSNRFSGILCIVPYGLFGKIVLSVYGDTPRAGADFYYRRSVYRKGPLSIDSYVLTVDNVTTPCSVRVYNSRGLQQFNSSCVPCLTGEDKIWDIDADANTSTPVSSMPTLPNTVAGSGSSSSLANVEHLPAVILGAVLPNKLVLTKIGYPIFSSGGIFSQFNHYYRLSVSRYSIAAFRFNDNYLQVKPITYDTASITVFDENYRTLPLSSYTWDIPVSTVLELNNYTGLHNSYSNIRKRVNSNAVYNGGGDKTIYHVLNVPIMVSAVRNGTSNLPETTKEDKKITLMSILSPLTISYLCYKGNDSMGFLDDIYYGYYVAHKKLGITANLGFNDIPKQYLSNYRPTSEYYNEMATFFSDYNVTECFTEQQILDTYTARLNTIFNSYALVFAGTDPTHSICNGNSGYVKTKNTLKPLFDKQLTPTNEGVDFIVSDKIYFSSNSYSMSYASVFFDSDFTKYLSLIGVALSDYCPSGKAYAGVATDRNSFYSYRNFLGYSPLDYFFFADRVTRHCGISFRVETPKDLTIIYNQYTIEEGKLTHQTGIKASDKPEYDKYAWYGRRVMTALLYLQLMELIKVIKTLKDSTHHPDIHKQLGFLIDYSALTVPTSSINNLTKSKDKNTFDIVSDIINLGNRWYKNSPPIINILLFNTMLNYVKCLPYFTFPTNQANEKNLTRLKLNSYYRSTRTMSYDDIFYMKNGSAPRNHPRDSTRSASPKPNPDQDRFNSLNM